MRQKSLRQTLLGSVAAIVLATPLLAQDRPNILVIMPDDVGYWNVGAYSHGMMVPTPNLDRIAKEGMLFTDHYSQPSSTPGRASFITGQMPIRTGLTTVSFPGSPIGIDARDPTLAEVLKPLGYRTGQFGKNHLGDRNSHLPTVHGFDVFFGNLYHLNTEEEPELMMWPDDPGFRERYGPRGVLDCVALAEENPEKPTDGRFGDSWGKQKCIDTGPLGQERMKTVDEEFNARAFDFIKASAEAKEPFFAWVNPSRMHIYTHLKDESRFLAEPYSSEFDIYGSGMMELDGEVGKYLDLLDTLGVAENTIVIFTTDNGAMVSWFPDAGATPFRGEKATTWEGGVRVPFLARWPAKIPADSVSNGIQSMEDVFTTLAAAAGAGDVVTTLKQEAGVCIDGLNNLAHWTQGAPSARNSHIYYNESELTAVRIGPWKSHMQTREGFFDDLQPSAKVFNLRMDPFEHHGGQVADDFAMQMGFAWGGQVYDLVGAHLASFKECPPRQTGGSLRVEMGD